VFAQRYSDRSKTKALGVLARHSRTTELAASARSAGEAMALLRDHGPGRAWPSYARSNGAMDAPCVHPGGDAVVQQTTASWVADLRPDAVQHWVTGTSAPCLSLFKPVAVDAPIDLGPLPGDRPDQSLWWRHEALQRRVMRDPERLAPALLADRDALEARWLTSPPASDLAFKQGDAWLAEHAAGDAGPDLRPVWARRAARIRAERAGPLLSHPEESEVPED